MRRLAILLTLPLALAACDGTVRSNLEELYNKPEVNAAWYVAPLVLATPPVNTVVFGPCPAEFDMPSYRQATCNLHYRIVRRGEPTPWSQTAARAQMMAYGPGELHCWKALGNPECIAVAGPPRPVNMIGPTLGSN